MGFLPSDEDKKRADDHLARMSPHYRKEEARAAFDGNSVPEKNIALRKAHDRIAELEAFTNRVWERLMLAQAEIDNGDFSDARDTIEWLTEQAANLLHDSPAWREQRPE